MSKAALFLAGVGLILLAGCGSGGNVVAVTPVIADTTGSYRLASSSLSTVPPGGAATFNSYSSGILRLYSDTTYTRSVTDGGQQSSSGTYQIGASVSTIPNSRHGSFSLTSSEPPNLFTGSYDLTGDFTLTLNYQFTLADQTQITRSETWIKQSDSPAH